jgi:predicted dehydrogenase
MGSSGKNIKVGIVGTGFIGPAHIEGLRRNAIPVYGLAEINPETAREKANQLGIEKSYPSIDAMLADPQIDVVHLAMPNNLHYTYAKAALLAGKHVVCEKPLAMTSLESGELVKLAAERNLVNAINFNMRFYPISQQARSMVKNNELGDLFFYNATYFQDWMLFPTDWNWRVEPGLGGSLRAVGDIGSHCLDLISFISGLKVNQVFADLKTFIPVRKKPSRSIETFTGKLLQASDYVDQPIQTEDYATIILKYENNMRGVMTVSQVSAGCKNRLQYEIFGSKSGIAWNSERPNELWIGHRDQPNQILLKDPALLSPEARAVSSYPGGHTEGFPDTFKQFSKKVYDYIRAGDFHAAADFPTFADGHYELVLSEAILTSAKESCWVEVRS